MPTYSESEVDYGLQALRDTLRTDTNMLRNDTQQNAASFLFVLGRALVYGGPLDREKLGFPTRTIVDALRHAGNNVLDRVGDDQKRYLAMWGDDMVSDFARDYAEDMACGLIEEMLAHLFVQTAGQAYLDELEENEEDGYEALQRELQNFNDIAKAYEEGLRSHLNGVKAITWAYRHTNFVKNLRESWPATQPVPWYLEPSWYEHYGLPAA